MFAIITDTHGAEQARYELSDSDLLDPDVYAERYSRQIGIELAPADMPGNMCGADVYVTLQEEPGSVVCWNSGAYFYAD